MGLGGAIDACEERIRALYGGAELTAPALLQVAAVWRAPGKGLRVLRINQHTPRSEHDAFALGLARARADAIVTTGRILREEPEVTHALCSSMLSEWRRTRLNKSEPARSLVLTSGGELDLDHPLLRTPGALIFTTTRAAEAMRPAARQRGIEVVGRPRVDLPGALEYLREACDAATISIEAGPSTSRELYTAAVALDELMLSIYEAPAVPAGVAGAAFADLPRLRALLPHGTEPRSFDEPSGRWSFQRRWR